MGIDWRDLDDLNATAEKIASGYQPAGDTLQVCTKCGGRGSRTYGYVHFKTYPCGTCKGTGKVSAQRLKNIDRAIRAGRTQERNSATRKIEFTQNHADVIRWMQVNSGRGFEFAASLLDQFTRTGSLTDNQLAAVKRCMQKAQVKYEERVAESKARSVGVDAKLVLTSLNTALSNGLRNPRIRFGSVAFTLAKPTSKNPGCVYIKDHDQYVGKITPEGNFEPVRTCTDEQRAQVVEVANDPLGAAQKHGHLTGNCSCCGRPLTNEVSTRLGIGPICREKYGWGA